MFNCLECQRLKRRYEELEKKYLIAVNKWLMLKRFILEQDHAYEINDIQVKTK